MTRKLFTAAAGLLALALFAGIAFVPASSASPGGNPAMSRHMPAGLTPRSIELARQANTPSRLVMMAPQASVGLLAQATKLGPHARDSKIKLTVGLKLRRVTELKQFLRQVQNPQSPVYHQWLTPEQFTKLYGPTKEDVAQVVNYLKTHGIAVKDVSPNRTLIHTEATTEVYEHVFRIGINDYKLDGRRFYSTSDRPALPRALAPRITGILGLNHGVQMHPHHYIRSLGAAARTANPYTPPPASLSYYSPLQIATAYDIPDITNQNNGAGVAIAIATAASQGVSSSSDFSDFWSAYGLPNHTINEIDVDGAPLSGGESETWLDIEYAGAMGPGATLNVYIAATPSFVDFADTYNQIVVDNSSAVMTTSWGIYESGMPESQIETDEQIFMQAAAQGISVFAAAGDDGTPDRNPNGGYNADYPSTSAYVTASNGTQLNISDLAGHYGSEVVWNDIACGQSMATGGAISSIIARPDWQSGLGIPYDVDMRMNSDVALTASCNKPMVVLHGGEWSGTAGTSAVAPQLAGIFAIADSRQTDRLGQSNKLFYDDANAGHYATDFHDVTEGCNGTMPDGSGSCAGKYWDHPTGWGSLDVTGFLSHVGSHGPQGILTGTVTDAATAASLAGAVVVIVGNHGKTYGVTVRNDGSYRRLLPAGDFTVTVSKFGYEDGTASVTITDDNTITRDFSLSKEPLDTLSGRVTDPGHGYGLYADIKVSVQKNPLIDEWTQLADVWTDPANGSYSLQLPQDSTYKVQVATAFNGYNTASELVPLSGNKNLNVPMMVNPVCTAPGYKYATGGFGEDFNNASFPPAGWTVTNAIAGSPVVWKPDTDWSTYFGNRTGGTGTSASVDSGTAGTDDGYQYQGPHDSSLVTPPIAVTELGGATFLVYKAFFFPYGNDFLNLDVSTDDGTSWRTIRHDTQGIGIPLPHGAQLQVNLAGYIPASGTFRLRWRDYDLDSDGWDGRAQIDDVHVGSCVPVPGSLLFGQVTDGGTGRGISYAEVSDDLDEHTWSLMNGSDPNFSKGTYLFFAHKGTRTLSVRKRYYATVSSQLMVPNGENVKQNFVLNTGILKINKSSIVINAEPGKTTTASFKMSNTGDGPGEYKILQINHALPTAGSQSLSSRYDFGDKSMMPTDVPKRTDILQRRNVPKGEDAGTNGFRAARKRLPPYRSNLAMTNADALQQSNGPAQLNDTGRVESKFYAGIQIFGLGVNHNNNDLWIGSPDSGVLHGDDKDHRFRFDGSDTGDTIDVSESGAWLMTDMAYDDNTGMFWQAGFTWGITRGAIYEVNPVTMQLTGKSIKMPVPEWVDWMNPSGLAYDPTTNTWYAADEMAGDIYHIDSSGNLLGWHPTSFPTSGLAYNAATKHLFALGHNPLDFPESFIRVFDTTQKGGKYGFWNPVSSFKSGVIENATAYGLSYDCAGDLVLGNWRTNYVYVINSGETGWCDFKKIPWLTVAPAAGTLAAGASMDVTLTVDGTGQEAGTTSEVYLRINHGTLSGVSLPITVHWDAANVAPVAQDGTLTTNENTAANGTLQASDADGDTLTFSITSQPTHGTVSLDDMTTGAYTYTPDQDYSGSDSFAFKASDGISGSNVATVSVAVKAVAPPPPPSKDDGGGALGWLTLAALLGLGFMAAVRRKDRRIRR